MDGRKKDLVMAAAGILAVGATVFGATLFMLGSFGGGHPASEASGAHETEGHGKSEAKSAADHGKSEAAHGKTEAAHGKTEAAHGKSEAHAKIEGHHEAAKTAAHEEAAKSGHKTEAHAKTEAKGHKEEKGHGTEASAHGGGHAVEHEEPKKVTPADPKVIEQLVAKGDAALARGRPDDAIEHYTKAAKAGSLGTEAPRIMMRWAEAYRESRVLPLQRRTLKAQEMLSRVLSDYPDFVEAEEALLRLGDCYRAMSKWQEVFETYTKYIEQYPDGQGVFHSRMMQADALIALERSTEALELLKKAGSKTLPPDRKATVLAKTAAAKLQLARAGQLPVGESAPLAEEVSLIKDQKTAAATENTEEAPEPKKAPLPVRAGKVGAPEMLARPKETASQPQPNAPAQPKAQPQPQPETQPQLKEIVTQQQGKTAAELGIPADQWDAVRKAVSSGKIREARRLMQPWLEDTSRTPEQMAATWMEWARMLNDHLAALKNPEGEDQTAMERR